MGIEDKIKSDMFNWCLKVTFDTHFHFVYTVIGIANRWIPNNMCNILIPILGYFVVWTIVLRRQLRWWLDREQSQAAGWGIGSNRLVSLVFQDPISYDRFIGATLYVPCLDEWLENYIQSLKSNIWNDSWSTFDFSDLNVNLVPSGVDTKWALHHAFLMTFCVTIVF